MPEAHSKYSASGFEAAMLCPGKRVMERGRKDTAGDYADEGTAAHTLLSNVILDGGTPADRVGNTSIPVNGKDWPVTDEMATAVQTALTAIHEIVGDGLLLSEQIVNYASYLGVPLEEAWGTSDIVALRDVELQVHDYKHGRGVEVDATENVQMKLYAGGALLAVRAMGEEPTTVRLVIHQPRIKSAPSEWTCTVAELEEWLRTTARSSVCTQINAEHLYERHFVKGSSHERAGWESTFVRPNEKSCKFCKAKAVCPSLRNTAVETIFATTPATPEDFAAVPVTVTKHVKVADAAWLGAALEKADLIEAWLAAVRGEVAHRLEAGQPVPGFKLVQGKRGNRAWANPALAEETLKGMRLKTEQLYDLKLISPTSAEKLTTGAEPAIGPRQWAKVKALITQADGKPSVAPVSDGRPALEVKPVADEFEPAAPAPSPIPEASEYA